MPTWTFLCKSCVCVQKRSALERQNTYCLIGSTRSFLGPLDPLEFINCSLWYLFSLVIFSNIFHHPLNGNTYCPTYLIPQGTKNAVQILKFVLNILYFSFLNFFGGILSLKHAKDFERREKGVLSSFIFTFFLLQT